MTKIFGAIIVITFTKYKKVEQKNGRKISNREWSITVFKNGLGQRPARSENYGKFTSRVLSKCG
jgi:hypothetical protein